MLRVVQAGLDRAIGEVAQSAAAPLAPADRAPALLDALRGLVPYDCAALSAWDALAQVYRPLANAGYSPPLLGAVHSTRFREELASFGALEHRRPLRIRDLPCDPASVGTIAELVWPAGLREGMTLALYAADGRHVGVLNLSTAEARHPTDEARWAVGLLAGALGAAMDGAGLLAALAGADHAGTAAVAVSKPEAPLALGTARSALLAPGSALLAHVCRVVPVRPARFLWPGADGWHPVQVLACREASLPAYTAVVAVAPAHDACGLTRRELDVLTLLAAGRTNATIADALVVARRTVSTHVERILAKLGAASRTEAAVTAVREGLLVPWPPAG